MLRIHSSFSYFLLAAFLVIGLPGCGFSEDARTIPTDDDDDTSSDDDDTVSDDDDTSSDDDDTVSDDDDTVSDDDDTMSDDDDTVSDDDDTVSDDDDTTGDDDTAPITPPAAPAGSGLFGFTVTTAVAGGLDSTIYLPDGAGPFPVIVLTHGFQLSPADYVSYGEHLASWGYVTVLPQFPGNLFSSPTHTELKSALADLLDWLDSAPTVLGGVADPSELGLVGHSLGGKVALLLTTEDARPDAVFAIDPVDAGPPNGGNAADYPSVAPELMSTIGVPVIYLGETQNSVAGGFGPACAPAGENFQAYYSAATSPAMEVEVAAANHMSFLDNPSCLFCLACPAGTDDPLVTKSVTRELMTAFFEAELRDEEWPDAWLNGNELNVLEASGLLTAQSKNGF
jgi:pimeloyl-ACP methyl ester carboxylesterase